MRLAGLRRRRARGLRLQAEHSCARGGGGPRGAGLGDRPVGAIAVSLATFPGRLLAALGGGSVASSNHTTAIRSPDRRRRRGDRRLLGRLWTERLDLGVAFGDSSLPHPRPHSPVVGSKVRVGASPSPHGRQWGRLPAHTAVQSGTHTFELRAFSRAQAIGALFSDLNQNPFTRVS